MANTTNQFLSPAALSKISEMPAEDFVRRTQKFVEAGHPRTVRSGVLFAQINESFQDELYSRALCSQLVAIATIRRIEALEIEHAFDQVVGSMQLNKLPEATEHWFREVQDSFVQLLNENSVRLVAKALHLSTDYSDLLVGANIVTDIRPVFSGDRAEVIGGMVSHILRLHFINGERNSNEQEFSLALDMDDVQKLISELSKCQSKSEAAKKFLGASLRENAFVIGEDTYGFD